jgi:hypothetical protein
MYTKIKFGEHLKDQVLNREDTKSIGNWVYSVYLAWHDNEDVDFLNLLLHLSTMELGPEFALSYEELEQIANNLILEKKVIL